MSKYRIKIKPKEEPKHHSQYDILTAGLMRKFIMRGAKIAPQDLKGVARVIALPILIFSFPYSLYMKAKIYFIAKAKFKAANREK